MGDLGFRDSSRLRLAILYSSVVGSLLLTLGSITHQVIERTNAQVVDHELDLLGSGLRLRLEGALQTPGVIPVNLLQSPELGLCLDKLTCRSLPTNSSLARLLEADYYLQLVDRQGNGLAGLGAAAGRFPRLKPSDVHNIPDERGVLYHVHYTPIKTVQGELWGYLQVGRSARKFDHYMSALHWLMGLGIPLAMVGIGGTGWWLAGIALRPVYRSYEKMRQFTADAAHEFRTPIAAMRAILDVALQEPTLDTIEMTQTLQALYRQADRLQRMSQDLLLLSRLDRREERGGRERLNLKELIQDLEEELMPIALTAEITLICEFNTNRDLIIFGNSSQLYRLFSNLITNAIHYTSAHGRVVVRVFDRKTEALIQIQDTGIGIAAEHLSQLFDRFYRVQSDRARQTGGVGLGLSIAQTISQQHGGRITVESTLGQGSCFTVYLPQYGSNLAL